VRRLARRALLFAEGDSSEGAFLVLRGALRVFHGLEDGREYTLEIVPDGGVVAIICLFDGGPYPASAEAHLPSEVVLVRPEEARRLAERHPDLPFHWLRLLATRLRRAHERSEDLAVLSVHERLAVALFRLAEPGHGAECVVELPPRTELAKMIGAARETVQRVLSDFRRVGALKVVDGRQVVLDRERLSQWIGGGPGGTRRGEGG
jgi:CRP/FNR family cyclic AMP-dependent transcriptional regulator